MNAEVLKRLEGYAGDSRMLKSAIRDYISSLGLTPNEEYVKVLEFMYKQNSHPTVEDVFEELSRNMHGLSRTKVHTILEILSKYGAVRVINIDKYTTHYDGETTPHAHFVCSKCGEVINMTMSPVVSDFAAIPPGAVVQEVQMICIGECKHCRDRNVN